MPRQPPRRRDTSTTGRIKAWYGAHDHAEWQRLHGDAYTQLEEVVTWHFLKKHLPKRGLVLDAGAGPGRYSLQLARGGYDLVHLDLVPEMVALAQQKAKAARLTRRFKAFVEGSIDDLSRFPDDSFDAVLCLGGPLSHLLAATQRRRAVAELCRVAKPGAPILVSVIGRLALLRGMLTQFPHLMQHARAHWETGDYEPGVNGEGFTSAHWFLPEELSALFKGRGVDVVEMAGLEGLSTHHAQETIALSTDKRRWRMWQEVLLATCTHPSVVGASEHFLLVAHKHA